MVKGDLLCPESLPFAMRKLIYRDAIDELRETVVVPTH